MGCRDQVRASGWRDLKGSRVEDNAGEALCLPMDPSRRICLLHRPISAPIRSSVACLTPLVRKMANVSDEPRSQSARLRPAIVTELFARVTEDHGRHRAQEGRP
jgi:hypothetical protein